MLPELMTGPGGGDDSVGGGGVEGASSDGGGWSEYDVKFLEGVELGPEAVVVVDDDDDEASCEYLTASGVPEGEGEQKQEG